MSECPAMPGARRCPPSICDCFIDMFPDDPTGLHPEVFVVGAPVSPVSLADAKADAWDEGYDHGFTDGFSDFGDRRADDNPYRPPTEGATS